MLNAQEAQKRLRVAHTLLLEDSTSRAKFTSVRTLIQGINPRIDQALERCDSALATWDKVESGDVIGLTAEHLPENTEEEKKRKKALLFFIRSWRDLQSEVARVHAEFGNSDGQAPVQQASTWGRIFHYAKGPLALVTVAAVGLVALQQTAVQITIENDGCGTMYVSGSVPLSLPGLLLPKDPIPSGGSAVAELPGLTVNVDGMSSSALVLRVLTFSMTFQLSGVDDVTLDGVSLLGKKTEVRLSESDEHTLILACS